jgi:hypothetical protein
MAEHLFDPDQPDPLARPCLQCRTPVTFDGQPGDATCPNCGIRQYLTEPSRLWPRGGVGAYPSDDRGPGL